MESEPGFTYSVLITVRIGVLLLSFSYKKIERFVIVGLVLED